jgi:hydrogenase expression/formation protein HypD
MMIKRQFEAWDARKIWEDNLQTVSECLEEPGGCKCGEVLRGLIESWECTLFGKACTPTHPVGPCMVSVEGSCNIEYTYKKRQV